MNPVSLYLHCFNTFSHIGPKSLLRIYQYGAEILWNEGTLSDFKAVLGTRVNLSWYDDFNHLDRSSFLIQEKKYLEKNNIQISILGDELYPERLAHIAVPPPILYIRGDISGIEHSLAIIGTRKYSQYGSRIAEKISRELSQEGIPIISGLALGIDSIAHKGCLEGKSKTIAVLAGGVDDASIYPSTNRSLSTMIISSGGALISEFPPKTKPRREYFVLRNRIVSGIARGVLVIEAPLKSGTLTTIKYALEQNRDVFAIPGNIDVKNSEGTNALIKQGAYVVTKSDDILEVFGLESIDRGYTLSDFTPEQQDIIQYLIQEPMTLELLAQKTNQSVIELMSLLSIMELSGIIRLGQQGEYALIMNIQ